MTPGGVAPRAIRTVAEDGFDVAGMATAIGSRSVERASFLTWMANIPVDSWSCC